MTVGLQTGLMAANAQPKRIENRPKMGSRPVTPLTEQNLPVSAVYSSADKTVRLASNHFSYRDVF